MQNYDVLAREIILQAVKDYRKALQILKNNPKSKKQLYRKAEIEEFIMSDWFKVLGGLDGGYLIKRLSKEAEEE